MRPWAEWVNTAFERSERASFVVNRQNGMVVKANIKARSVGIIEGTFLRDMLSGESRKTTAKATSLLEAVGISGKHEMPIVMANGEVAKGIFEVFDMDEGSDLSYTTMWFCGMGVDGRPLEPLPDLTSTELAISKMIRNGLRSKEVADRLNVSTKTIENHRTSIRKKLSLKSGESLNMSLRRYDFRR